MYGGPAKNVAENFGRLGGASKLFSMVGEDSLGETMRTELAKAKIDTKFLEVDTKKVATATKITVQLTDKQLRSALGTSTPEDLDDSLKSPSKEIVQVNDDVLQKVAYRYLYPHLKDVNDSRSIFADLLVNENGVKALIQNFGSKLFLYLGGSQNAAKLASIFSSYFGEKKHQDSKDPLYGAIYLSKEEAATIPRFFCESLKAGYFKQLCAKKTILNVSEKFDFEAKKEEVAGAMQQLRQLVLAENLFVRVKENQVLVADRDKVVLVEHNCAGKCVVSENGADEAFIAGYLKAYEKLEDERMEYAAFAMISALKTELNVNDELSEAMLKRMQQNHFVSIKTLGENKKEDTKEEL